MRDQYIGDIGDYIKYGLLRAISVKKCLGVAWYLCVGAGSTKAGDGRHTDYLRQPKEWRHLDPELFDTLKRLVDEGKRSVSHIEQTGILGKTAFASEPLDIPKVMRNEWFERTKKQLCNCTLVFADPDNGLYPDDRFNSARKESVKRIPLAEATALANDGRAVVIYHHNNQDSTHCQQIRDWMDRLPGCTYAYYWRCWSPRTFFIMNPDSEMEDQLKKFAALWNPHGKLVQGQDHVT